MLCLHVEEFTEEFIFPPEVYDGFISSTLLPTFCTICQFDYRHSSGYEVVFPFFSNG